MYAMSAVPADPAPVTVPAAFDDFYELEYRALTRLAFALTGSTGVAEDLVQETMLRAYKHWNRIAEYDKPGAWARRVLINLATSRRRRIAREAKLLVRIGRSTNEELLDRDDSDVWKAVRTLPPREAQVVALFYAEDKSITDIAELLAAPEGTVKALLHRARKKLAAKLGEEET